MEKKIIKFNEKFKIKSFIKNLIELLLIYK